MLQVIEFTDTDNLVKIILWFKNIVVNDKLKIIDSTVIYIPPVAQVVNTVKPGGCQASFAYLALTVYHYVSRAKEAVIMECYYSRNVKFHQHGQNGCGKSSLVQVNMCYVRLEFFYDFFQVSA